jgi:hypothetical protein
LVVAATTEDNMSTKGGGNGTPSYKQVVVDRGERPTRHRFQGTNDKHLEIRTRKESGKEPEEKAMAWGKKPEKLRMLRKKQRAPMGQKGATHVNQNNNDTQGNTGRSTNTTLQGPDEDACANLQVYGFVAHRKNVAQLD